MIRFAADALATYRLTRLVTDDVLTAELRDAFVRRAYRRQGVDEDALADRVGDLSQPGAWSEVVANDPNPPKLAVLVTCPWCASVHLGLLVVTLRRMVPRAWGPLAEALAFSAAAGLVAENLQSR